MGLSNDLPAIFRRLCSRGEQDRLYGDKARAWIESDPELAPALAELGGPNWNATSQLLLVLRSLAQQEAVDANSRAETSLVVTDPTVAGSGARFTGSVVREMCEAATREIFVAGFAISAGSGLERNLPAAAARGCRIVVVAGAWGAGGEDTGMNAILRDWPATVPRPECYVHEPTKFGHMHIKALIVDGSDMLVGSANFTLSAVKNNFELGLRVRGKVVGEARKFLEAMSKSTAFTRL